MRAARARGARRIALVCITHDSRESPGSAGLPPHVQELERSALGSPLFLVAETMRPYLNRSVVLDRVDFETARYQLPSDPRRLVQHRLEVLHGLGVVLEPFIVLVEFEILG